MSSAANTPRRQPQRIALVYDGDSGFPAILADVIKKLVGKEDCPLCEITYSALGKRSAWRACESRLGIAVEEIHRDRLPVSWGFNPEDLPCILGRGDEGETPWVLLTRWEIVACRGRVEMLEHALLAALTRTRL